MSDEITAIVTNIITAIDTERTDVIVSVLSELGNTDNHEPDLLQKVLNDLHTDCGTLLHYATKSGQMDKVRTLLSGGADPGIQNKDGLLPIDLASDQVRTVYNEELLKATAQSNVGRVCQLLAGGVDIHLIDSPEMQNTPLHWATCHATRDMVQCLCARGADLNAYNNQGFTPLHDAVKRGDAGIVEELLNYGADAELQVTLGENVGQTAMDLAHGKESVMQVLRAPRELPEPISRMNSKTDSKASLMRYDSVTSNDSILTTGEETLASPRLSAPVICNGHSSFEVLNDVTFKAVDERLLSIWPPLQVVRQGTGNPFTVSSSLPVFLSVNCDKVDVGDMAYLWNLRRGMLESLGLEVSISLLTPLSPRDSPHIVCHLDPRLSPSLNFYRINVSRRQIKIQCGGLESLSFAVSTLVHLITLYREEEGVVVPSLLIEDWPDMPYRGVLLDVSQGRISCMESVEEYLDTLSLLKVNQVYLYTRFHSNLPLQWQCPHSKSEILHMSEFCHKRLLQLIPVVEVGPKVNIEDLAKLYPVFQDFLICFPYAQFVSAGPRLSSFLLDATDETLSVVDIQRFLPVGSHQTLQLCGYPLHDLDTSLLQQLPPGIIFKEYAVKADHDYSKYCSPLAQQGINYFVCPGTASWNSLAGCPEAALGNIMSAGLDNHGALGLVICDWTGKGHLNHQLFSWPGILAAAGLAWNKDMQKDFLESSMPSLLNQYVFRDNGGALGSLVMELGRAETYAVRRSRNQDVDDTTDLPDEHGSILYRFLTHPDAVPLEFLSLDALQYVIRHVKKCQLALPRVSCLGLMGRVMKAEATLTMEIMLLACKIGKALVLAGRKPNSQSGFDVVNFGVSNLTVTTRTDLANRLLEQIRQFRAVWAQRSNPEVGLGDSVQRLRSLFKVLLPDTDPTSLLAGEQEA